MWRQIEIGFGRVLPRILTPAIGLLLLGFSFTPAEAQYFGRNKVHYEKFQFQVLRTPHFDIHYYPEEAEMVEDAARMAERWYERFARLFQHEFEESKPIVFYADHADFQQTNTLQGFIGEGTGGVTESLKNRVILPMTGSYQDSDHVLGHELVHAFQYNMAQSGRGIGLQSLVRLPDWLVEGMAEYLSVGREDPLTAMWLRDALIRDDLPTIEQMTKERRFFPYRFGQAIWAYIGGTYGDEAVVDLFRSYLRVGWEPALRQVLGTSSDSLSVQWHETIRAEYTPFLEGRSEPDRMGVSTPPVARMRPSEVGHLLLSPSTGAGRQNVSPSISPDGRYIVFISEKDLFTFEMYLADASTGKIVKTLTSQASNPEYEALRFLDSSGSWSPDGQKLIFAVFSDGSQDLAILDVESREIEERIVIPGMGAIANPAWSPDGRSVAFSGSKGGISDLYVYDLETERLDRLTEDKYADFQPAWSPDGRTIAFVTDRGPETDFETLSYSEFQLATIDVPTRTVRHIPIFGNVKHMNPQFSPDGAYLYFISDVDGVSDIYRIDIAEREVGRLTRIATGVSGITSMSPAMSVARESGQLAFSVFDESEFHVLTLDPETLAEEPEVVASLEPALTRNLPPATPLRGSRIEAYLADADMGLVPRGTYSSDDAEEYESDLQLDFIGQPSIGIGADAWGGYVAGGASAFFSDMLGDRLLGVAVSAQGTFKDIGAQVQYYNMEDRWNWGVAGGRIPYQMVYYSGGYTPTGLVMQLIRQRVFIDSASGVLAYPLSSTRRLEGGLGFTRYSFDLEVETYIYDQFGRLIDRQKEQWETYDPLNLFQASVAFVGDHSYTAFTSPVRGGRYRFELQGSVGTVDFLTVTADYRRYFNPSSTMTLAFRALHFGRYGKEAEQNEILQPFFLGYETMIRGYAWESFTEAECSVTQGSSCPELDRLFGHRLAVANLELRVPFLGTEQFGLLDLPYVPMELVAFADIGMAWDSENQPNLIFSRESLDRVPVMSTGFSARMNLLGFMILEAYYAYPFQRPNRGWHWGFVMAPGW